MSLVIPVTAFERSAVRYIRHQRALGLQFRRQTYVLRGLARFLAERDELDAERFEAWMRSLGHTSGTSRRSDALVIRKFCLYRRRTEPDSFVPDPLYFPRRVPSITPVILGPAEIGRMLDTVEAWPANAQHPLYKAAYHIALILLYTTGMRRGEREPGAAHPRVEVPQDSDRAHLLERNARAAPVPQGPPRATLGYLCRCTAPG